MAAGCGNWRCRPRRGRPRQPLHGLPRERLDGRLAASSICFDYGSTRLLYNSGHDPDLRYYSVGLLLNALCLRDAIDQGKAYFDFLRGSESYKYHLGGRNRTLYQMVVTKN